MMLVTTPILLLAPLTAVVRIFAWTLAILHLLRMPDLNHQTVAAPAAIAIVN